LQYDGPPEYLVTLDETLFHRVLINLIDNAIKHSPRLATIYVTLGPAEADQPEGPSQTKPDLCLQVIDTGPGFNARDLPYIFDRFYRADPARSRGDTTAVNRQEGQPSPLESSRGSGLGLAIVTQIVEAHGGTIAAANHPDSGGAWLRLWLPHGPG
jgi:two-component system phosphate regulon sensor histidine kinase PhoR